MVTFGIVLAIGSFVYWSLGKLQTPKPIIVEE